MGISEAAQGELGDQKNVANVYIVEFFPGTELVAGASQK
jgi:hypothetical protein